MDMKIIEQIFAADKHVRFVGILASDLKTVLSKARQDLETTEGKKCSDDSLVHLAAPIVLGTLSNFADKCGKLICAGVRYNEVTLIFFKIDDMHVVVSADPGPPYIIMQNIEEKLQI